MSARVVDGVGLLARLVLGGVFVVAGALKVTTPEAMAKATQAYQVLPHDVAAYVGYAAARPGDDEGALATAGLAEATTGEQIFTAAGCAGCHTFQPAGSTGTIGPDLDDLASAAGDMPPEEFVRQSILDPDAEITEGFQPGVMPAFEGRLNDEQVQALVQYLLGN